MSETPERTATWARHTDAPEAEVDDHGIRVVVVRPTSYDVVFDDHAAWSFTTRAPDAGGRPQTTPWPEALKPWLDGTARVVLRPTGGSAEDDEGDGGSGVVDLGTVSFGSGKGRIEFVDRRGLPVVVDKWGIVQRPFSTRGDEVTAEMAERTRDVIRVLSEECGIEAWMAFGTLLGAARSGHAIGHDSDVDLLYLSEHSSPARITLEGYAIKRALARHGIRSVLKTGSFVTVLFEASDGAPVGIDVYASFYLGGLLHETATVRAPIPRAAILPLTTMPFEGLDLPAPQDPGALLEASYGPRWSVPDPSFRHAPGPEITQRFDGWFGSSMTHRRAWEMWHHRHQDLRDSSPAADRLLAELDGGRPASVVDVGAGSGSDALAMARRGHRVLALDYARRSFPAAVQRAREEGLDLTTSQMNVYDLRDVLSLAALNRRRPRPPRAVLARNVLDALHPRGTDNFHRFVRLLLGGGGRLHLELEEPTDATTTGRYGTFGEGGAPRYAVRHAAVVDRLRADGADLVIDEVVDEVAADEDGPARRRWCLVASWGGA